MAQKKQQYDALLQSLIFITRHYGKPFSAQALMAGLPEKEALAPEHFIRAADKAGFDARMESCSLQELDPYQLPAIIIDGPNQVYVVIKKQGEQVQIIKPDEPKQIYSPEDLHLQLRTPYLFLLVQPQVGFSDRAEEMVKRSRIAWFWQVVKQAWPIYGEVLLASLLINLFALATPLFTMNVYDRVVPNNATDTLWVLASGIGLVLLFDIVLRTLRAYFVDSAGKHIDLQLSAKIFAQILGIAMPNRPQSVGALMNSVYGFESFREFITSSTMTILVDLPFVLLYLLFIAIVGGILVWIPIFIIPLVIFIGFLTMKPLARLTEQAQVYAAEKQATLVESLSGIEAIKCSQAEGVMQQRWESIHALAAQIGIRLRVYANSAIHISIFAQQFASVLVVIAGVYLISEHQMTTGGLIACTILTGRALASMSQVATLMTRYNQSISALHSVAKVMELPNERRPGESLLERKQLKGRIEFRNVSFSYPNQPVVALKQVNLTIEAGERIAVIGRIGSGKTTFAKLLLGFYQPTEGMVLIDSSELRQIDLTDLRSHIAYVPQDVLLFYGTVKDNIRFGKPYLADEKILELAHIAGVDRFLKQHPKGFELQVGERGCQISGGQRQAVTLARALADDPSILLLDEPTNSMDDSTEALVKANLAEYCQGKTLLLITHKASMLSLVDRVIVMDEGRIAADGPKDVVLGALKDGKIKVSGNR